MDRKINLAKIAIKNVKKLKNKVTLPTTSGIEQPLDATQSSYFSPLKTRNQRKELEIKNVGNKNVSNENIEATQRAQTNNVALAEAASVQENQTKKLPSKKGNLRKHIIIGHDANQQTEQKNDDNAKASTSISINTKDFPKIKIKTEPEATNYSDGKKIEEPKLVPVKKENENRVKVESEPLHHEKETKRAKWEPKNWQAMLENIREMRKHRLAPVDTMGCHKCSDENADEKTQRFHHLISLMLSSQTKDNVTYDAMIRLKTHGLTPEKMCEISSSDLEKLLYPVSFYKTKAKNIQKTAKILIDSYACDIPNNVKELIGLPGVGPKMAHICMRVAWNIISGIGVDTHVHRISNRLKWLPKETKEPEQTRIGLEQWCPFELWSEINELMVGFGQTICTPTNPKCGDCLNYDICPSRVIKKKK